MEVAGLDHSEDGHIIIETRDFFGETKDVRANKRTTLRKLATHSMRNKCIREIMQQNWCWWHIAADIDLDVLTHSRWHLHQVTQYLVNKLGSWGGGVVPHSESPSWNGGRIECCPAVLSNWKTGSSHYDIFLLTSRVQCM